MSRWIYTVQFSLQILVPYIHICMTDPQQYSSHTSYIFRQYLQNWTQLELLGGALKHKEATYYSYKQQWYTRMLLTVCHIPNLCEVCSSHSGAVKGRRSRLVVMLCHWASGSWHFRVSSSPRKILQLLDPWSWRHYSRMIQNTGSHSPNDSITSPKTRVIA